MKILGTIIGAFLDGLKEVSRAAISASLRNVADRVDRGDLVSDEEIGGLKASTARIRDMLNRAPE